MRLKRFDYLPADIREAIAEYDAMVDSGEIHFDDSGYADEYPGMDATEKSLSEFLISHGADRP